MQPHRKIYIVKLRQPQTGISETNFHCLKIKVKFRFNINTAVHIVFYFYKIISIVFPLIETVMLYITRVNNYLLYIYCTAIYSKCMKECPEIVINV